MKSSWKNWRKLQKWATIVKNMKNNNMDGYGIIFPFETQREINFS